MENEFSNTPKVSYCVDGETWLSTRKIKDMDGNLIYKIPVHSWLANNVIYFLRGIFELIKVVLGSALIYMIVEKVLS